MPGDHRRPLPPDLRSGGEAQADPLPARPRARRRLLHGAGVQRPLGRRPPHPVPLPRRPPHGDVEPDRRLQVPPHLRPRARAPRVGQGAGRARLDARRGAVHRDVSGSLSPAARRLRAAPAQTAPAAAPPRPAPRRAAIAAAPADSARRWTNARARKTRTAAAAIADRTPEAIMTTT